MELSTQNKISLLKTTLEKVDDFSAEFSSQIENISHQHKNKGGHLEYAYVEHFHKEIIGLSKLFQYLLKDVFNTSSVFDQLVLFSGDGDYMALVDDLISKGKKVILVFAPEHKGREYVPRKGLFMCTVNNLKPHILSETNIPTDFSVGRDSSMVTDDTENSQVPGM